MMCNAKKEFVGMIRSQFLLLLSVKLILPIVSIINEKFGN